MSKTNFTIAFDGPGLKDGRMDVRDLAPALLALGRVIETANRTLNGSEHPVKVEVVATDVGSFEVAIDVVLPLWEQLRTMLISPDVDGALKLIEIIGISATAGGGLIWLLRQLRGRQITTAARGPDGTVTVRFPGEDGSETSIIVPQDVLRLYQEIAVQRELGVLLETLEKEAVETIAFYPPERNKADPPPVILTRADRGIAQQVEPVTETVVDTTQKMALSIRSLAFTEGNKWRLYDGQNVITATIDDKEFLERVDRSLARFAKGDILVCMVRTIQKQAADGLKTEHTVLRVLEHRPAPTQVSINFDPPSALPKG
jgi:hypothetical protein